MNWDQIEGKWEQMKGHVKENWGKFTDNDISIIQGKKDQLLGRLREIYGYTVDQADSEIAAFMKNCSPAGSCKSDIKDPPLA